MFKYYRFIIIIIFLKRERERENNWLLKGQAQEIRARFSKFMPNDETIVSTSLLTHTNHHEGFLEKRETGI